MSITKPPRYLLSLVLLVACALLAGCQSADIAAFNEQVAELKLESANTDAYIAKGQELIATLPDGPERDKVVKAVEDAKEVKVKIDQALTDYLANLPEDPDVFDTIGGGAKAAAGAIPQPYGTIIGLGGILATWIGEIRRRKTRAAAVGIIKAIDIAKSPDGVVNFRDPVSKATLLGAMPSESRALVEAVRNP